MMKNYLEEDLQFLATKLESLNLGGSTILITGATGLIGSLCVKSIIEYNKIHHKQIKVVALVRSEKKVKEVFSDYILDKYFIENIKFIYQDILDPIQDDVICDYIIHTANSTTSQYFISNPVEVIDSIYTGTKRILDYGKKIQAKGIVYLSSMEVFGKVEEIDRVSEEQIGYLDIQNIRSCYSEGKRLAELLCKSYSEEYKIPVKIARLAQTFGAGVHKNENRVFAQFARSAKKGENIILHTTGESVGNYCYTVDVISAIYLLLIKGENGDVYTVVNEETTRSISDMAKMVAQNFSNGKSEVIFDIPKNNVFGYAPSTKLKLSAEKLRKLGWLPQYNLLEMYSRMLPYI